MGILKENFKKKEPKLEEALFFFRKDLNKAVRNLSSLNISLPMFKFKKDQTIWNRIFKDLNEIEKDANLLEYRSRKVPN